MRSCFICGGTRIRSDINITAAKCFRKGATVSVRINASDSIGGIRREVETRIPHPGYDKSFDNDIMVTKLRTPVSSVVPVALNELSYTLLPNAASKLCGFGAQSELHPTPSKRLRAVSVLAGDFESVRTVSVAAQPRFASLCNWGAWQWARQL